MRVYKPAEGADRFPQAIIEGSTEYDWDELPEDLRDVMRHAADKFRLWADGDVIPGELAHELEVPNAG